MPSWYRPASTRSPPHRWTRRGSWRRRGFRCRQRWPRGRSASGTPMAALLLELGLDPGLGKALYVIGRAPGLVAHVFEEQSRERPYRDIGWRNVRYDGPGPREP